MQVNSFKNDTLYIGIKNIKYLEINQPTYKILLK